MDTVESRLTGGHPNSLGNTIEIVDDVLAGRRTFLDVFSCYFSKDEVVRLRVSNAMKRIYKEQPIELHPYIDRFLNEIALIDQPSTQWTFATLFMWMEKELTLEQKAKAQEHMKNNLANHQDWIVLNNTMETLTKWSKVDLELRQWLTPHLKRLEKDERKSVAKRAVKFQSQIKKWEKK